MKNPYLVFTIVFIGILSFFYLYPADIFESEIIENGITFEKELTLKNIFLEDHVPAGVNPDKLESIKPTLRGWFMIFIILIGLPLMLAYRVTLKRYSRRAKEVD